ncbi:MAG: hypothetical protein AB8G77_08510 [Rhodothermales bacterium]
MKAHIGILSILILLGAGVFVTDVRAQQASLSPHGEIDLQIDCASCHRTEGWTPILDEPDFDHNKQTRFALTGSHLGTQCASCHLEDRFDEPTASATQCAVCHIDVHQGAFSENCVDCHNTSLFQDVEGIGIHAQTNFPLTGSHAQLTCISCHTDDANGAFTPLETACVDCHEDDYNASVLVDHVAAGFPLECESCHTDLQWQGALFEHLIASSGFDLIGAHEGLACASCHESPDLASIFMPANDQDCISCHQEDYDDEHAGSGFPTTCIDCHNQDDWDDAEEIDHFAISDGFALVGAHQQVSCGSCHNIPDYSLIFQPADNQDCISCHQEDYDDEHAGSGFPLTCLDCHNQDDWDDAEEIDHLALSGSFALVGAHQEVNCSSCHNIPDYSLIFHPAGNEDCISCHQDDYDDEHNGTGIPVTCIDCHNQDDWDDADFDHDRQYFPIFSGEHRDAWDRKNCLTCHLQPQDFSLFSCEGACHEHTESKMNNEHRGVSGYVFEPVACLSCHPDGDD